MRVLCLIFALKEGIHGIKNTKLHGVIKVNISDIGIAVVMA